MNEQNKTSPAPFTTRIFDHLRSMQAEIQCQNKEMGWYDGMENKFTDRIKHLTEHLDREGYNVWADAIRELNTDYERLMQERLFSNCCMNMVGEVAEMFESFRSGTLHKPCDKAQKMEESGLPVLTAEEEEIADVVIRALDYGGRFDVDVARAVMVKHIYNRTRGYRHGNKKA
jgi:hypothetical protein